MHQKQTKLLLLWERMGDYHRARWKALAQLVDREACLAADYGTGDGLYQWANTEREARYFCLSDKPVDKVGTWKAFGSFRRLMKAEGVTHVCVPGYGRLAYVFMMLWARMKGIKVLMFAESWYAGNNYSDLAKSMLVRLCADVCFVSGKRAAGHFVGRLHFPSEHVVEGYSVVNNAHFASGVRTWEEKLKVKPQLLCVARYAPEKNLALLIKAFKQSQLAGNWQLRIVGGGPLKPELEQLTGDDDIVLDDWLGYDQLPEMYGAAACFVLPSSFEPWGLVVNEAMAAGLPIILSDQVGALPDLLSPGNGWQFKYDSVEDCVTYLNLLAGTSAEKLMLMGEESRKIIDKFTPETWAEEVYSWAKG